MSVRLTAVIVAALAAVAGCSSSSGPTSPASSTAASSSALPTTAAPASTATAVATTAAALPTPCSRANAAQIGAALHGTSSGPNPTLLGAPQCIWYVTKSPILSKLRVVVTLNTVTRADFDAQAAGAARLPGIGDEAIYSPEPGSNFAAVAFLQGTRATSILIGADGKTLPAINFAVLKPAIVALATAMAKNPG